jgi:hypothetical protein
MRIHATAVILAVILSAVTGAVVASVVQANHILTANGLHIRGEDGKLYARLESWTEEGQASGDGQSTETHGAHLVFYDAEGNTRLQFGTSARGASISFFDHTGTQQIRLHLYERDDPTLIFSDKTGRTLFEAGSQ